MNSENILRSFGEIADKYIAEARPKIAAGQSKAAKLFKKPYFLAAALMVLLLLAACAFAAYAIFNVTFPISDKGKTEFNTFIYDVEPFDLSVQLPSEWSLKEREPGAEARSPFALISVWSILDMYNENGEVIGAVGYNVYEEYEGAEDDPRAIYNQIALGNNYHFDVRESYTVVKETAAGKTATAAVYYSASINGGEEKINKGIVSYDRDLSVYVAMEFAYDMVSDGQIMDIARSIEFVR